jgi:hypothetical protein
MKAQMDNRLFGYDDSSTEAKIQPTPSNLNSDLSDEQIAQNVTFAILDCWGNSNPDDCIDYWPTYCNNYIELLSAVFKAVVEGNTQEIFNLARANSSESHERFLELRIEWDECYFFQECSRKIPILHVRLISEYEKGWVKTSNSM